MRLRLLLAAAVVVLLAIAVVVVKPFSEHDSAAEQRAESAACAKGESEAEREAEGQGEGEACGGEAAREVSELSEPSDFALMRAYGKERPKVDPRLYWQRARQRAVALGAATADTEPEIAGDTWALAGPTTIGGRVLDVVVDPTDANHGTIFIAAATGGVWKSTDRGQSFTSAWPDNQTQTIGALAIASDGTLYAGTGEAGPGGGSSTYGGTGVYRSSDHGATWQSIGLADTNRIGRIVVDPRDPKRVFVAGTGPLYKHGGGRGLYESTDGGDSWTKILAGDNDTAGAADVALDPKDPNTIYASMWDNFREPDKRTYEGLGSGLYKSSDGGRTWARIGTPFFGPRPDLGRIGVAVAPDGTVYANAAGASGLYNGFYTSTDGGQTFTTGAPPANPQDSFYTYGWWFGRIYVDPQDSQHVYQAALNLQESKDGGRSWANAAAGTHSDHHGMAFDPAVPNRVYLGNDGGVFRSDDNGVKWTKFKTLPISQINGFDVSQVNPTRIVAGLQDNGSNRNWSGTKPGGTTWVDYTGGDGQRTAIAPNGKDDTVYGCSQYGVCQVDGGASWTSPGEVSTNAPTLASTRNNWFQPIEFDPGDPNRVFSGGDILNVSTDKGQSWTPISPVLPGPPGRETNPLFRNYGTITTIAPAKGGKTIYAGTDDGRLWFTHDSSSMAAWTQATDTSLPTAWITRVEVDPADSDTAYVAYSGFRQADDGAYLLKTTDGGVTWKPISAGLPRAPINDVNVIGRAVVVATDVGVFLKRPGDATWLRLGHGLPIAPAYELRYVAKTDQLFVGTFGRGIYKTDAAVLTQ
jgi:photosystem II stability/assembly factor-like uncharacterized protein